MNTESPEGVESLEETKKKSIRSLRRSENKNRTEYVIKASLVNSLNTENCIKNNIVDSLRERSIECSKGLQRLSFAINILLKKNLECHKNPLHIKLPKFLTNSDTTFFRQLMIGIENAKFPDEYVERFLKENDYKLPSVQKRFPDDKNTITRAAEQYLTNYKTYLLTTFHKKQSAFLNAWYDKHFKFYDYEKIEKLENSPIDFQNIKSIKYLINGWELQNTYILDKKTEKFIKFQRKLLDIKDGEFINDFWIKNNYEKIIIYYDVISKYLIKHGNSGILLAPICKMKNTFIHVDTDVFHGILLDSKLLEKVKDFRNVLKNDKDKYWNMIFNTEKYLTVKQRKTCNFTHTIQSDGVSICIHYSRPHTEEARAKKEKKESKVKIEKLEKKDNPIYNPDFKYTRSENDRVIGQDPGRSTIFSGAEKLKDGTWKKYELTKRCYYEKSGINEANKNSKNWNKKLKTELDQLSTSNTRSTLEQFLKYVKIIKDNYDSFWNEYTMKKWSRQRLKTYSGKKRVFDNFFKSLQDDSGRRVVVAYGDAGFASTSKYETSAPVSRVLTETKKWFRTVMVDEFRTTQLHSETGKRLSAVKEEITDSEGEKIIRTVRGLLWCYSTNGSKFVNRDFDASKSIVECYNLYPERPKGFSRDDEKQKEPNDKYIKSITEGKHFKNSKIYDFFARFCKGRAVLPFT